MKKGHARAVSRSRGELRGTSDGATRELDAEQGLERTKKMRAPAC